MARNDLIVPRKLPKGGLDRIRASLAVGGPLSTSTQKQIDLARGVAYGYVPESARPEQLGDFDEILFHPSGPFPLEVAWRAIDLTIGGLRTTQSQVIIVDDQQAGLGVTSSHAAEEQSEERTLLAGATPLRWKSLREGSTRDVADFIGNLRRGENAFFVAGVETFRPREEISPDRLDQLGRSVMAVLIGAFDAVSYVVWYRGDSIPQGRASGGSRGLDTAGYA